MAAIKFLAGLAVLVVMIAAATAAHQVADGVGSSRKLRFDKSDRADAAVRASGWVKTGTTCTTNTQCTSVYGMYSMCWGDGYCHENTGDFNHDQVVARMSHRADAAVHASGVSIAYPRTSCTYSTTCVAAFGSTSYYCDSGVCKINTWDNSRDRADAAVHASGVSIAYPRTSCTYSTTCVAAFGSTSYYCDSGVCKINTWDNSRDRNGFQSMADRESGRADAVVRASGWVKTVTTCTTDSQCTSVYGMYSMCWGDGYCHENTGDFNRDQAVERMSHRADAAVHASGVSIAQPRTSCTYSTTCVAAFGSTSYYCDSGVCKINTWDNSRDNSFQRSDMGAVTRDASMDLPMRAKSACTQDGDCSTNCCFMFACVPSEGWCTGTVFSGRR